MSYTINGNDLSGYYLTVIKCEGALDIPGRLGDIDYDWGDSNGIEAFTDSDDLKWNGRRIDLTAFYSGSSMIYDMQQFKSAFAGSDLALVTSFGTFTVRLMAVEIDEYFRADKQSTVVLSFWQKTITPDAISGPAGGNGVTIGGYDFMNDFGLSVRSVRLQNDTQFRKRSLSYPSTPVEYNGIEDTRAIRLELNGKYTSKAAMISNIEALRDLLMSSGTKTLFYMTSEFECYFADAVSVRIERTLDTVFMTLNLRVVTVNAVQVLTGMNVSVDNETITIDNDQILI